MRAENQPQRVDTPNRLLCSGRAAVGRDDTAALRVKPRTTGFHRAPIDGGRRVSDAPRVKPPWVPSGPSGFPVCPWR